jgi:uncharacterized DUF497 family protein
LGCREGRSNLAKHGIEFHIATDVFADPYMLIVEDCEDEHGEMRYHAIGYAGQYILLVVVFVDRSSGNRERIHIISARKAVAYEESAYSDQF